MPLDSTNVNTASSIMTSDQITLIVISSIIACLLCIYAVFFFGRKLQSSAMLRSTLVEGVKQQELTKILEELIKRGEKGPLDPENNPAPPGYDRFKGLYYPEVYKNYGQNKDRYFSDSEQDQQKEWAKTYETYCNWENKEKALYESLRKKADDDALKIAENKVPKSIDISLLGGGFSFLLEFSTVIVIIFTLLILGILGNLEGKEISTILAAIAGYVLGKASSVQSSSKDPSNFSLKDLQQK